MNTVHAWNRGREDEGAQCHVFLANHSAYIDGELSAAEGAAHERHAAGCASCARYMRVLARGTTLLRAREEVAVSPEFEARLQHRLFHLQDEAQLARPRQGRVWLLAAAALAALLVLPRLAPDQGDVIVSGPPANPTFPMPATAHPHEAVFGVAREVFDAPAVPIALMSQRAELVSGYTPVIIEPPLLRTSGSGAE